MENQNTVNLSKKKMGKSGEKDKEQMGQTKMNSKKADLNSAEHIPKLSKNDLNIPIKGTEYQTG